LLVSGAFVVYHNVSAQAPTPTTPGRPGFGWAFGGGMMGGVSQQNLAAALGIDLPTLQAAYKTANTEALKEAVSKNLITQAQSDQITARGLDKGPVGGFARFGANGIDYNSLLANALGITTDKLQAANQQAFKTNLDAAVTAGKMTQAQADAIEGHNALYSNSKFITAIQSAFTAAVNQAVTDGVITQAQADQILKNGAGNGMMNGFNGRGMLGSFRGFRGSGGQGRRGSFNGGKGASPAAPTATPSSGA
jgi:hypothetical protein